MRNKVIDLLDQTIEELDKEKIDGKEFAMIFDAN